MALKKVVVQHPKLEKVKYTVPEADVARWVKQHWIQTDDKPTMQPTAGQSQENLTVAQRVELGLPATAGEDEPAPKAKPKTPKTQEPTE